MDDKIDGIKKYIKSLGFDIDLENKIYKEAIKYCADKDDIEGLINYISKSQNCGGFALEIPICIWPVSNYSFEEKVLRILELYPFVRLLSNSELKKNEYIVKYRAQNGGHHFIKINEKGETVEKNESSLPHKFNGWGNLESSPEAVFAVIKQEYRDEKMKELPQCNRDMFLDMDAYEYIEDGYTSIKTKKAGKVDTFEGKLIDAYNKGDFSFLYNDKIYYLKPKMYDENLIYILNENEIYGTVCTDGETTIVELKDEKKNDVFGFKPSSRDLVNSKKIVNQKSDDLDIEI